MPGRSMEVDLDWSIWKLHLSEQQCSLLVSEPFFGAGIWLKKSNRGKDTDPAPLGAYGQLRDESPLKLSFQRQGSGSLILKWPGTEEII